MVIGGGCPDDDTGRRAAQSAARERAREIKGIESPRIQQRSSNWSNTRRSSPFAPTVLIGVANAPKVVQGRPVARIVRLLTVNAPPAAIERGLGRIQPFTYFRQSCASLNPSTSHALRLESGASNSPIGRVTGVFGQSLASAFAVGSLRVIVSLTALKT